MEPESPYRAHCRLFTGLTFFIAIDTLVRFSTIKMVRVSLAHCYSAEEIQPEKV